MLQDSPTWSLKYFKVFMGNEQIINEVDWGIYTYKQKRTCEMSPFISNLRCPSSPSLLVTGSLSCLPLCIPG